MFNIFIAHVTPDRSAVGYFEAWQHWFAGDDISNRVLWILPIFWWARIAKVVGLTGGLLIVADILGAEKVRSLANSIQFKVNVENVMSYAATCFKFVGKLLSASVFRRDGALWFSFAAHVTSLLSATYWAGKAAEHDDVVGLVFVFAYAMTYFFIALILPMVLGIALLFILVPVLCFTLLLEILANALDNPRVEKRIQILSLLLLVMSFHFDFMAS